MTFEFHYSTFARSSHVRRSKSKWLPPTPALEFYTGKSRSFQSEIVRTVCELQAKTEKSERKKSPFFGRQKLSSPPGRVQTLMTSIQVRREELKPFPASSEIILEKSFFDCPY